MYLLLDDEITKLFEKLKASAFELKLKFDNNDSIEILKGRLEVFNSIYEELSEKISFSEYPSSLLTRHIRFLNLYLGKKGDAEGCAGDIAEICNKDIDELKQMYLQNIKSKYIDLELEHNIKSLIETNQFDSAVRKSFLTLTERLRSKYNIPKNKDGVELINLIFGKSGKSKINSSEKESLRDLLSGFYGVFRNDFMHTLQNKERTEISIIYMINTLLTILKDLE